MSTQQLMKVKDVATELGVSPMQVHKLITGGDLPAVNVGQGKRSYWRVARADLTKYLDDKRAETARRFGAAS